MTKKKLRCYIIKLKKGIILKSKRNWRNKINWQDKLKMSEESAEHDQEIMEEIQRRKEE